jgi:hypothetical protein
MADTISTTALGISPVFPITAEELNLEYFTTVTPIDIDGVNPPDLGADGGHSYAMNYLNLWFPWIDEKIVEPKWDQVTQFLGLPSNRPSFIRDYHMIALFRAADYVMQPIYAAHIQGSINTPVPFPAPEKGE